MMVDIVSPSYTRFSQRRCPRKRGRPITFYRFIDVDDCPNEIQVAVYQEGFRSECRQTKWVVESRMHLVRACQPAVAVYLCIATGLSCGSGQADEIRIISDAAIDSSRGCGDGCNPVTQQGCEATQKCSQELGAVATCNAVCLPAGVVEGGGDCTFSQTSPSGDALGVDDCVAGFYCHGGTCLEICWADEQSCPGDASCLVYAGTFDYLGEGINIGLCTAI